MKKKSKINAIDYQRIDGKVILTPLIPLTLDNSGIYAESLNLSKDLEYAQNAEIDLSKIEKYDSYSVIFLNKILEYCIQNNILYSTIGLKPEFQRFYSILSSKASAATAEPKEPMGFWTQYIGNIGAGAILAGKDAKFFIEFLGELMISMFLLVFKPVAMRWRDFPFYFLRAGVNALPIVLLIVFLIGVISGYQGAIQLRQFGADIYIADLIGISITRELSPLMTAILVAGRSGSAFAAEIGTMKVSEEIDALQTMGFDLMRFLVLPRVFAVMLAAPILTMLANLAGIAGGLLTAVLTLNITMTGYFNQLQIAVGYWDLFTGLGKSVVFGFLVAAVGCFRGLQARGGAESVGNYTTASVVTGVLLIIIADAVFTFIFQAIGI